MRGTFADEIQLTAGLTLIIFSLGLGFPAILDFRNGSFKMELQEIKNYLESFLTLENSIGFETERIQVADTGTDENFFDEFDDDFLEFDDNELDCDKIFNTCTYRGINFET